MSFNTAGGLLGTAVGFVVLGYGLRLISDTMKSNYKKKGYKIHPMSKLNFHLDKGYKITGLKKSKGILHQKGIALPNMKFNIKI